jgi:hypothetical protein
LRHVATLAALVLLAACGSGSTKSNAVSTGATPIATALRGPAGPPGPPGPAGLQGPQGQQGVAGTPAVVDTVSLAGLVEDIREDEAKEFTFVGPTTTIGVADGQRITASGSVALGTRHGDAEVSLAFCLAEGAEPLRTLVPDVYSNVDVGRDRHLFPVIGTGVPGAGTYTFGVCLRRVPPEKKPKHDDHDHDFRDGKRDCKTAIDDNDYAVAWAQVFR